MTTASVPAPSMSSPLWDRVLRAFRANDERELWFAWRVAFHHRFWKQLGLRSAGAACEASGVAHTEVLRRLTAYEFRTTRDKVEDMSRLERELAAPK